MNNNYYYDHHNEKPSMFMYKFWSLFWCVKSPIGNIWRDIYRMRQWWVLYLFLDTPEFCDFHTNEQKVILLTGINFIGWRISGGWCCLLFVASFEVIQPQSVVVNHTREMKPVVPCFSCSCLYSTLSTLWKVKHFFIFDTSCKIHYYTWNSCEHDCRLAK